MTVTYSPSAIDEPVGVTMIDEVDIAAGRLLPFAAGLGVDELTLRLVALAVWTESAVRSPEDKVTEIRRRLMRAAGA